VSVDDPIEMHLDHLLVAHNGSPREIRRTLAEVEAHLLDASAEAEARGLSPADARAEAVRRIGPPEAAVGPPALTLRLTGALRRQLVLAGLLIGGVAGVAVGVAGAFALAIKALWGAGGIATAFPTGSYTAADCERWRSAYPSARDCLTAMTADHADDFLRNAVLAAVLGVVALLIRVWLRRRWSERRLSTALPSGVEWLAGAVLAAVAGAGLLVLGLDAVLTTQANGAGQPLSLALAALFAAAFFAAQARQRGWSASLR
jgi:hypothetical protein